MNAQTASLHHIVSWGRSCIITLYPLIMSLDDGDVLLGDSLLKITAVIVVAVATLIM